MAFGWWEGGEHVDEDSATLLFGSGDGGGPVHDLIEERVSFVVFDSCKEKGYRGLFSVPSRKFCCWCFGDLGVGK